MILICPAVSTLADDLITGSQQVQQSTIPGATNSWKVPCNTQIQFTVSINSQAFSVDQSVLVAKQSDGTCISIIEGFTDASVTQSIFGQTWISQLYVYVQPFSRAAARLAHRHAKQYF